MAFTVPENHREIYDEVVKKCYSFIHLKYWDKIEKRHLDRWLSNFKSSEERYLAALILNKVIYRNQKSIISSLTQLFHIILPDLLSKYKIFDHELDLEEWEQELQSKDFQKHTNFLFSEIVTDKLGNSSSFYMRLLRENFIHHSFLRSIKIDNFDSKEALIFIDDIIGSGTQASEFISEYKEKLEQYRIVFFIPLIAHEKGLNKIKETCDIENINNIVISPIELLSQHNSFFQFKNNKFDGLNTIQDLKDLYEEIVDRHSLVENRHFLYGLGELELLLLFSTGVPDNTLPLIYTNGIGTWHSLQKRF